jgi:serine carboxypeptidase-like clade 2
MWIGGESYSGNDEIYLGMYVPCTAEVIVKKNLEHPNDKINLKGILVGNGVLVNDDDFFDKWNLDYMVKRNFYDLVT